MLFCDWVDFTDLEHDEAQRRGPGKGILKKNSTSHVWVSELGNFSKIQTPIFDIKNTPKFRIVFWLHEFLTRNYKAAHSEAPNQKNKIQSLLNEFIRFHLRGSTNNYEHF